MPHRRSHTTFWFATLAAIATLAACQADAVAVEGGQPATENTPIAAAEAATPVSARVVVSSPPGSLDPARVGLSDMVGRDLVENLYVGLTQLDPDTNSIVPALATEWSTSSDGLRWTFSLREDVMWAAFDPATQAVTPLRPVTAEDVVYAIRRACHPATDAPHAASLFIIEGCRQINNTDPALVDEAMLAQAIGVAASDPTTVSFELEEAAARFLTLTATPIMRPLPPEAFAVEGAEWRDAGLAPGSGSWLIEAHTPGEQITLVANPEWPIAREGNVTAVEMRFAPDDATAYAALQSGEADLTSVPAGQTEAVSLMRVEARVSLLVFAADQFPMDDVRVRRALAAAIDRQRIVDDVLGGQGLVTAGFVPPGSVGAPNPGPMPASPYNPDYARSQMEAAGYPRCQLFPRVTLVTDRSDLSLALAQAYIRMWQDNLSCNDTRFDIRQDDMRLLLENVSTPLAAEWQTRPHITALTWQADYPDADNWLGDLLHCERGYLQVGRECAVVDDLIERAARERNPDARTTLYAEIEALFFGENGVQPVAPVYTAARPLALEPWITVPVANPPLTSGSARYDRWQVDTDARP